MIPKNIQKRIDDNDNDNDYAITECIHYSKITGLDEDFLFNQIKEHLKEPMFDIRTATDYVMHGAMVALNKDSK